MAPPGGVAHLSPGTLAGADKTVWQALHTVFSFFFVLAGAFHLYFNWRIFESYLRSRLSAASASWSVEGARAGPDFSKKNPI